MKKYSLLKISIGAIVGYSVTSYLIGDKKTNTLKAKQAAVEEAVSELTPKLENVTKNLQHLQKTMETVLPPFINGVKMDVENFKFRIDPRLEQLKEDLEKL